MPRLGSGIRERKVIVDGKEVTHYNWRKEGRDLFGVPRKGNGTAETLEQAEFERAQFIRLLRTGDDRRKLERHAEMQRITLRELIQRYMRHTFFTKKRSHHNERIILLAILNKNPLLADRTLLALHEDGTKIFAEYRDKRINRDGVSWSTFRRELNPLRHMFKIARREWGYPLEPIKDLMLGEEEEKHSPHILAYPEEDRLLYDAISEHFEDRKLINRWLAFVLLALSTCLRSSHLRKLTWRDVDFKAKVINIPRHYVSPRKNAPPVIPLHNAILYQLSHYWTCLSEKEQTPGARLFPIKDRYVNDVWTQLAKTADLHEINPKYVTKDNPEGKDYMHFHDLRHTAKRRYRTHPTHYLSPDEADYMMGHKNKSVSFRYEGANTKEHEWVEGIRAKLDAVYTHVGIPPELIEAWCNAAIPLFDPPYSTTGTLELTPTKAETMAKVANVVAFPQSQQYKPLRLKRPARPA